MLKILLQAIAFVERCWHHYSLIPWYDCALLSLERNVRMMNAIERTRIGWKGVLHFIEQYFGTPIVDEGIDLEFQSKATVFVDAHVDASWTESEMLLFNRGTDMETVHEQVKALFWF